VLLAAADGPAERSVLRLLKRRAFDVAWARTASELRSRADRIDLPAPEVVFLELSLCKDTADETVHLLQRRFALAAIVALGGELDGERAARLLSLGVPSLNKPVSAVALAELAWLLASRGGGRPRPPVLEDASTRPAKGWIGQLEAALESYASNRALSQQQRLILRFYLSGDNDKEIAQICACSEATIYEHWRRMGKKAGGSTKADVIADFHRYLVGP
jgi:DNA-binding NarL/FixJ family response regulator